MTLAAPPQRKKEGVEGRLAIPYGMMETPLPCAASPPPPHTGNVKPPEKQVGGGTPQLRRRIDSKKKKKNAMLRQCVKKVCSVRYVESGDGKRSPPPTHQLKKKQKEEERRYKHIGVYHLNLQIERIQRELEDLKTKIQVFAQQQHDVREDERRIQEYSEGWDRQHPQGLKRWLEGCDGRLKKEILRVKLDELNTILDGQPLSLLEFRRRVWRQVRTAAATTPSSKATS